MKRKFAQSAAEREAAVREVLSKAGGPMTPSSIASEVNQEWCMCGRYPVAAPVSAVLKRIGAVCVKRGFWLAPKD